MREFFKGWRRKAGIIALMLALLFMGGWVRSTRTMDQLRVGVKPHLYATIVSFHQKIYLFHNSGGYGDRPWSCYSFSEDEEAWAIELDLDAHAAPLLPPPETYIRGWRRKRLGWPVFYRSIVCPLTLLSAYLLFSKPRPTKYAVGQPLPTESE